MIVPRLGQGLKAGRKVRRFFRPQRAHATHPSRLRSPITTTPVAMPNANRECFRGPASQAAQQQQ